MVVVAMTATLLSCQCTLHSDHHYRQQPAWHSDCVQQAGCQGQDTPPPSTPHRTV